MSLPTTNPFGVKLSAGIIAAQDLTLREVANDTARYGKDRLMNIAILFPPVTEIEIYLASSEAVARHGIETVNAVSTSSEWYTLKSLGSEGYPENEDYQDAITIFSPSEVVDFFDQKFNSGMSITIRMQTELRPNNSQRTFGAVTTWEITSDVEITIFDLGLWCTPRISDDLLDVFTIGEVAMLIGAELIDMAWTKLSGYDTAALITEYRQHFDAPNALLWLGLAKYAESKPTERRQSFISGMTADTEARNKAVCDSYIADIPNIVELSNSATVEYVAEIMHAGVPNPRTAQKFADLQLEAALAVPYIKRGVTDAEFIMMCLTNGIDAEIASKIA